MAYHEAGHALVAEARPNADRVGKISMIPRGIAVLLGGRVAEEIVFGDISTGAQNDLQRPDRPSD